MLWLGCADRRSTPSAAPSHQPDMPEDRESVADDLYAVLGLPRNASSDEVRTAYRRLTQELAAGRVPGENQRRIEEAFETLGDPIARLRYDARAFVPPPRAPRFPIRTPVQHPAPRRRQARSRTRLLARNATPLLVACLLLAVVGALFVLLVPHLRGSNRPPTEQASARSAAAPAPSTPAGTRPAGSVQPSRSQPPSALGFPPNATGSGPSLPPPARTEPLFVSGSAFPSAVFAIAAASLVANRPAATARPSAATTAAPTSPSPVTVTTPTPTVLAPAPSTPVRLTATSSPNRIFVPTAPAARSIGGEASSPPVLPVSSSSGATSHLP